MEGRLRDEGAAVTVVVGGDARQRFHDARGYGRPLDGNRIALAPVEAAHLLFRGDLDAVAAGADRLGFRDLLVRTGVVLEFVVYKDLRDRGFYLSPAREDWDAGDASGADFVVYPRGKGPGDGAVAHRIRVLGEREPVPMASLGEVALAVVDEEGELTYLETTHATAGAEGDGTGDAAGRSPLPDAVEASLLADRALVWDPPADLHESAFYGQRLAGRNAEEGPLQASLVEAAYLARHGALALDEADVVERGRAVEGERFDRRLTAYGALRDAGAVPKSGFKFGADFRVYDGFESVDGMGHSDRLVRVVEPDHEAVPRDLSLDVRLAGGVRKRMVFALTAAGSVRWLSVARLTP
ncbi:MAG: tRNA-intron lyase [Haloferacaceae archaeon]